jgi:mRNA interferase MazF
VPRAIKRGQIYWVDFSPVRGREQGGRRPALVVQNDIGNRYAPTIIVAAITSKLSSKAYPMNVGLPKGVLPKPSEILCSQLRTVDKGRLGEFITFLDQSVMRKVDEALKIALALDS